MDKKPFTHEEYLFLYSRVPRVTIEVIAKNGDGVLLTKRAVEPYKDMWHIPGATFYIEETVPQALTRIVKQELGCEVISSKLFEYKEYQKSDIQPTHDISLVFYVYLKGEVILDDQSSGYGYFIPTDLPEMTFEPHKEMLKNL